MQSEAAEPSTGLAEEGEVEVLPEEGWRNVQTYTGILGSVATCCDVVILGSLQPLECARMPLYSVQEPPPLHPPSSPPPHTTRTHLHMVLQITNDAPRLLEPSLQLVEHLHDLSAATL